MANYSTETNKVSVQEWSNSQDYLLKISRIEDMYLEASAMEDVQAMILHLRNLCSVLKRMVTSSKSRNTLVFQEKITEKKDGKKVETENPHYYYTRLTKARKMYSRSNRPTHGNPIVASSNAAAENEALEILRRLYEDLGDFQMSNNLTFSEGIDPYNAVFEG